MNSKAKTAAKAKKPAPVFIHEKNGRGEHRIVVIIDGKTEAGEWTRHDQIAVLNNIRAATDHFAGVLPDSVFQVRAFVDTVTL